MTPGNEQQPIFEPQAQFPPVRLPGAWAAALIAAVAALITGYLVQPDSKPADRADASGNSALAEVTQDVIGAALDSVAGTPQEVAQFRAREACKRKLAWVTIARDPNQPGGRIRLQSGKYISPAYELTDASIRVALPYPALYPAGRGTIAVIGTASDARIALTPPWHVSAAQGFQSREVTWSPTDTCPAVNP